MLALGQALQRRHVVWGVALEDQAARQPVIVEVIRPEAEHERPEGPAHERDRNRSGGQESELAPSPEIGHWMLPVECGDILPS